GPRRGAPRLIGRSFLSRAATSGCSSIAGTADERAGMFALVLLLALRPFPDGGTKDVLALLARNAQQPLVAEGGLEHALAHLGPTAFPGLLAVLAGQGGLERELDATESDALVGALASFGPRVLRAFAEPRFAGELAPEERRGLLAVLARIAARSEID